MGYTFGMAIETRHGNFLPGQPLPPEWDTRETRRQLVKQFGKDVLNHQGEMAISSMAATLKAIEESDKQQKQRAAELEERERRIEEKLKWAAASDGESGMKE